VSATWNICRQCARQSRHIQGGRHTTGSPIRLPRRNFSKRNNHFSLSKSPGRTCKTTDIKNSLGRLSDALELFPPLISMFLINRKSVPALSDCCSRKRGILDNIECKIRSSDKNEKSLQKVPSRFTSHYFFLANINAYSFPLSV
jgi:hypothetical protein